MTNYVLLTAARNEEDFIEKTLQSVVAQTVLPLKWIIVSDGSTDGTDELVLRYAAEHSFIELVRAGQDSERNFGSKAKAVMAGYGRLTDTSFDYVGNLDADVSFDPNYFANIFNHFADRPKLGLAGGVREDYCNGRFVPVHCDRNSVGGPFQLFRRQCFEQVGGYLPLQYGGIDAVAEISARMFGWEVESFPQYTVYHHRCTGTAGRSRWQASFRAGIRDYSIGYHPLFEISRLTKRMWKQIPFANGLVWLSGYFWAMLKRLERPVDDNFLHFFRQEQMSRLRATISKSD
jgi:glycosyltransferase involved in cell wall biosynthesis